MNQILTTCVIGLISIIALADSTVPANDTIDQQLLLRYLADQSTFTLIDARAPEEYQEQHVNGAINIPHDRLAAFKQQLPDDSASPLIVYCRTGRRAGLLKNALMAAGYTNIKVLPAAQLFWSAEAPPVFNCGYKASSLADRAITDTMTNVRELNREEN